MSRYCRKHEPPVMLFAVALTVLQPVHEPLPVSAFGPERTWPEPEDR